MQAQQLGRLSQADLSSQISSKSFGIRIFRFLDTLLVLDRALCESPKEPEIQRVQKHDPLPAGLLDDHHLSTLYAVDDLWEILGQVLLREMVVRVMEIVYAPDWRSPGDSGSK